MMTRTSGESNTPKQRRISGYTLLFVGLLILPLLAAGLLGVLADYHQSLPNGYRIVYLSSRDAVIMSPGGEEVVRPHVTSWAVRGKCVSGLRVAGTAPRYIQGKDQWYLLDTGNGDVSYFDTKADLEKALRRAMGSTLDI